MSKSLGNFYVLGDLTAKGFTGREIRYLLLTAHYRETFNFTLDGLSAARSRVARIDECLATMKRIAGEAVIDRNEIWKQPLNAEFRDRFEKTLDDDLNVSAAWASVSLWLANHNAPDLMIDQRLDPQGTANKCALALAAWQEIDRVMGLGERPMSEIPAAIIGLQEMREEARKRKNFKGADAIRDELKSKGWLIEDTPKGARLKRI